jgi:ABC-type nickel/cobalt efflux system permease component RcnA
MEILAAFSLGLLHGLEPDHLATVSLLVLRGAGARASALAGLRFGIAHAAVLLVAGSFAVGLNLVVTPSAMQAAELMSGAVLFAFGVWVMVSPQRGLYAHTHRHEHGADKHEHLHLHRAGDDHGHAHVAMALGGLFALGGARTAVLVGLPALNAGSAERALLSVLAFGVGIFLSMSCAGWLLGRATRWMGARGDGLMRWVGRLTGVAAAVIGAVWLVRSVLE